MHSLAVWLFGWRRRGEQLTLAARLNFWLGLRRLLGFFAAFVFASHARKHATIKGPRKSLNRAKPLHLLSPLVWLLLIGLFSVGCRSPCQVVVVEDGIEDEPVGPDGFATVHRIVGEE